MASDSNAGPPVAGVQHDGEALRFTGALLRDNVPALWKQVQGQLDSVRTLDLSAASSVDSAGLALLAEIAARCGTVAVKGSPEGLAELRDAYRLDAALGFGNA